MRVSGNSPVASHCCVKGYESQFVLQWRTPTFACREWPKLCCLKDLRHANSRTPSDIYDRRFVGQLESYFTKTEKGGLRTQWIVPSPIFVSSAMSVPVQVADVCVYCINWGFRLPARGMDGPVRQEIANEFGASLAQLQYKGLGHHEGQEYQSYGIVFVSDPYWNR
jgi:hypothetical protein